MSRSASRFALLGLAGSLAMLTYLFVVLGYYAAVADADPEAEYRLRWVAAGCALLAAIALAAAVPGSQRSLPYVSIATFMATSAGAWIVARHLFA